MRLNLRGLGKTVASRPMPRLEGRSRDQCYEAKTKILRIYNDGNFDSVLS